MRHNTGTDLAEASQLVAEEWADHAYRDEADRPPALQTGRPEMITTLSGQQATIVKVTATLKKPSGSCKVSTGSVYAVSATGFTGELGLTAVLVIVADVGVPGTVTEAEIRQILSTLRPAT